MENLSNRIFFSFPEEYTNSPLRMDTLRLVKSRYPGHIVWRNWMVPKEQVYPELVQQFIREEVDCSLRWECLPRPLKQLLENSDMTVCWNPIGDCQVECEAKFSRWLGRTTIDIKLPEEETV